MGRGAGGGVACPDGFQAVVGEGRAVLEVSCFPEGDILFICEEGGIIAVAFGSMDRV